MIEVKYKLLRPGALALMKSFPSDAGWDVSSTDEVFLHAGDLAKISTGLALAIPEGWYGQLFTRSGMAGKGLIVLGGVLDASYRGEVVVILKNAFLNDQKIRAGDRIAQLVILPVPEVTMTSAGDLPDTLRSTGGLGSTGN